MWRVIKITSGSNSFRIESSPIFMYQADAEAHRDECAKNEHDKNVKYYVV